MSSVLPLWVEWMRALAVPAIAFAGVLVAAVNLYLGFAKRSDDLFDRRYSAMTDVNELSDISISHATVSDNLSAEEILIRTRNLNGKLVLLFDRDFAAKLSALISETDSLEGNDVHGHRMRRSGEICRLFVERMK